MSRPTGKIARAGPAIPAEPTQGAVSITGRLRKFDRTQRHAVLATSSGSGPHASLVAFVLTKDGTGIVFATPTASSKYRNMYTDSNGAMSLGTFPQMEIWTFKVWT